MSTRVVIHIILATLVWYLLAGSSANSWFVGVPAIIASLLVLQRLPALPNFNIRGSQVIPFSLYFVQQSILGGFDVARRAFHPKCPLNPTLIDYKIQISNRLARVFLTNVISLLPGTLSACLKEKHIVVHVLDDNVPNQENISELERRVGALFGETV